VMDGLMPRSSVPGLAWPGLPGTAGITLVVEKTLSGEQEDRLREAVNKGLGHSFAYRFTYVDEIPRSAGGKYEDFRVELES